MKVEITVARGGEHVVAGTFSTDSAGKVVATPATERDKLLMANILREGIWLKSGHVSSSDAEAWLRALPRALSGTYLRARRVEG